MQKPTKSPKKAHEDALNNERQKRHNAKIKALNLRRVHDIIVPDADHDTFKADAKKRAAVLVKRAMKAKP